MRRNAPAPHCPASRAWRCAAKLRTSDPGADTPEPPLPPGRLISLDFLRGVAVLGILTMNVVAFAWPSAVYFGPRVPGGPAPSWGNDVVFLIQFVLFDGKLRGLFTLLFGASMILFVERAWERGEEGEAVQGRRLAWLALFGLLHYYLLWWGDILFLFAACGLMVIFVVDWPVKRLALLAAGIFAFQTVWRTVEWWPEDGAQPLRAVAPEIARNLGPWQDHVWHMLTRQTLAPLNEVQAYGPETIPLMILGMVFMRTGMLSGRWERARLQRWAICGVAIGLVLTLPIAAWLWFEAFDPPLTVLAGLGLALPGRLAMTIGYAAALVLASRRFASTPIGERLIAAGRMAFSNYIATTLVMTALFQGWGLGLYGRLSRPELTIVVALGWVLMLAWSRPWLARYRQGPLEWLWRSLTYWRVQPFARKRALANDSDSH